MLKRWNFLKTGFYEGIKVARIEQGIAADVRENLFNRLAQTVDVVEGEENPYSDGMLYVEPAVDTSGLRSAWWDFKEEIRSRARFFGATTAAILDRIFENLASLGTVWGKPVVREIKPGDRDSSFWRARAITGTAYLGSTRKV